MAVVFLLLSIWCTFCLVSHSGTAPYTQEMLCFSKIGKGLHCKRVINGKQTSCEGYLVAKESTAKVELN